MEVTKGGLCTSLSCDLTKVDYQSLPSLRTLLFSSTRILDRRFERGYASYLLQGKRRVHSYGYEARNSRRGFTPRQSAKRIEQSRRGWRRSTNFQLMNRSSPIAPSRLILEQLLPIQITMEPRPFFTTHRSRHPHCRPHANVVENPSRCLQAPSCYLSYHAHPLHLCPRKLKTE